MEKIIFEDLPSTKTPLNAENLNKIQENVENNINEINNKFKYSTEEQVIGTWFGKPLYKKVVANDLEMGNGTAIDVLDLNIKEMIDIKTREQDNNTQKIFFNAFYDNDNLKFSVHYQPDANKLESWSTTATTFKTTIIIEYTKTTD